MQRMCISPVATIRLLAVTALKGALGFWRAPVSAQTQPVIYTFTEAADGGVPIAGVIRDKHGNLYGTTVVGGNHGTGTVFKVTPSGSETVLYSFTDGADGGVPYAGVIRDKHGNLYGTTLEGGASNAGVVFKVAPSGSETVLYSFTGGADGANPAGGVIMDRHGNLYGTTNSGGASNAGVVYKLDPSGNETVLYTFTGGTDGGNPALGSLVMDTHGNLYGTTESGGNLSTNSGSGSGVVFKLAPSGSETVLYTFNGGADGGRPLAGVIRDKHGNLYGTTLIGGTSGAGSVFKVAPSGSETVLYNFTGGADGANPIAGVIRDKHGNLYGTAADGGDLNVDGLFGPGAGVVFKITP